MSDQKKGNAGLIALGITAAAATAAAAFAAYQYFTDSNRPQPERPHENRSPVLHRRPPRRRSTSDSSSDDDTEAERRQLRSTISPPRELPTTSTSTPTVTPETNRDSRNPQEISKCFICGGVMRINTIELYCGHIFHDECLTIWRHVVVTQNPAKAKLCPSC